MIEKRKLEMSPFCQKCAKKEIPKGITYLYVLKSIVKKSPIGQGEKNEICRK